MMRFMGAVKCALLLFSAQILAAEPIKFGISPWTSPHLLQAWAKPVEEALEKQTGVSYQISSAANLQKYLLAAVEGQYEILQTPMHLGLYLVRYHNFKPLVFARAKLKLMVLTRQELSIEGLAQLKGTSMAVSGPLAMATFVAQEAIVNKLFNVNLVPERNHWKAMEALQKKRMQSAVVGNYLYARLSPPLKSRLKVLYEFPIELDGLLLVSPGSSPKHLDSITSGLLGFEPHKSSLLTRFEKVTEKELNGWFDIMNTYVNLVNRYMNEKYFSNESKPSL